MDSRQLNIASDHRKGDFKKTVDADEGRRRRADTTLKIRKQKKDQQLKKKRAEAIARSTSIDDATFSDSVNHHPESHGLSSGNVKPTIADAPRLMSMLVSPNATEQTLVEATKGFRRILSVEKNVPAREIIDLGILPFLVRHLSASSTSLVFESAWALTNIASTECTMDVVEAGCTKPLVQLLRHSNSDVREQSAWCLGNIAGEGPSVRDLVLQEPDALESLLLNMVHPASMSHLENVVWTISNLCRGTPSPPKELTAQLIYPLVALLDHASISEETKVNILWALSYLTDGDEQKIELVLSLGCGVALKLIHLLEDDSTKAKCKTPVVRILGNFVSGNHSQTQVVLDSGILNHLARLLGSRSKPIRKDSSWMASNIACGNHEQITMLLQKTRVLRQLIKIAKTDIWEVRKEALWALASICTNGTYTHAMSMADAGGLEPLIAVLGMHSIDPGLLVTILDAIRQVLEAGRAFDNQNYIQMIEENDGIECLEELQNHPSEVIYEKAVSLIEDFFDVVDEDDENLAPVTNESGTFGFGFAPGLAAPKQLFANFNEAENGSSNEAPLPFGSVTTNINYAV